MQSHKPHMLHSKPDRTSNTIHNVFRVSYSENINISIPKRRRRIHFVRSQASSHEPNSNATEQRNLPILAPPSRGSNNIPPPPPPPPPPPFFRNNNTGNTRRDAILSVLITAGVAAGMITGFSSREPSSQEEKDLAYIASQVGVPSMPTPITAVVNKESGRVEAVAVAGKDLQYLAIVDPDRPSRLILAAQKPGGRKDAQNGVYALQTRYVSNDLENRRQVESIFRVAGWEDALERLK